MVLFFSCYLINCDVDEPARVTALWDAGNSEQKSQPCRIIASLGEVLTSRGRTECSWASASMELPPNSPPEAPCRRRSLVNIKQHFSYCCGMLRVWGPPRGTQRLTWQPYRNQTTLTFSSNDISVIREGREKQPCWIISEKSVLGSVGTADHQGKWPSRVLFFFKRTSWWTHHFGVCYGDFWAIRSCPNSNRALMTS